MEDLTKSDIEKSKKVAVQTIDEVERSLQELVSTFKHGIKDLAKAEVQAEKACEEGTLNFSKEQCRFALKQEIEKWTEDTGPIQASITQLLQWINASLNDGIDKQLRKLDLVHKAKLQHDREHDDIEVQNEISHDMVMSTDVRLPALVAACCCAGGASNVSACPSHVLRPNASQLTQASLRSRARMLEMSSYRDTRVTKFRRAKIEKKREEEHQHEMLLRRRYKRLGLDYDEKMKQTPSKPEPNVKHVMTFATKKRQERLQQIRQSTAKHQAQFKNSKVKDNADKENSNAVRNSKAFLPPISDKALVTTSTVSCPDNRASVNIFKRLLGNMLNTNNSDNSQTHQKASKKEEKLKESNTKEDKDCDGQMYKDDKNYDEVSKTETVTKAVNFKRKSRKQYKSQKKDCRTVNRSNSPENACSTKLKIALGSSKAVGNGVLNDNLTDVKSTVTNLRATKINKASKSHVNSTDVRKGHNSSNIAHLKDKLKEIDPKSNDLKETDPKNLTGLKTNESRKFRDLDGYNSDVEYHTASESDFEDNDDDDSYHVIQRKIRELEQLKDKLQEEWTKKKLAGKYQHEKYNPPDLLSSSTTTHDMTAKDEASESQLGVKDIHKEHQAKTVQSCKSKTCPSSGSKLSLVQSNVLVRNTVSDIMKAKKRNKRRDTLPTKNLSNRKRLSSTTITGITLGTSDRVSISDDKKINTTNQLKKKSKPASAKYTRQACYIVRMNKATKLRREMQEQTSKKSKNRAAHKSIKKCPRRSSSCVLPSPNRTCIDDSVERNNSFHDMKIHEALQLF